MIINWADEDMRVSRSEVKKGYDRLQKIAIPLASISKKQMKKLPISEFFLDELIALASITSNNARKRQIKRVTKMIAEENRHELIDVFYKMTFAPEQVVKIDSWYDRLTIYDKSTVKLFLKQFKPAEYNTIYQILLWIEYAKHLNDDELLMESRNDLKTYIHEMAILSKVC